MEILVKKQRVNQVIQKKLMDQPYSKTDFLMGTVVTLKIYDKGKEDVLDKGFDRIKDLAAKITTSDSEKNV